MTSKIAKLTAVIALTAGLVVTSAAPSRADDLNPLFGGLIGGGLGAGVGYAAGKNKGAMIGGLVGLGIGALIAHAIDESDNRRERRHAAYVPPPPGYEPAPVYTPAPYDPAYQPGAYQPPYQAPVYGQTHDPYAGAQYSQAQCRQYNGSVNVNGNSYPSYGTACLQPDGTWRMVN